MKLNKRTKWGLVIATLLLNGLFLRQAYGRLIPKLAAQDWPVYTAGQLARYDGSDQTKPVLLALDGYVYDISPGREQFYAPGQVYHDLAGKDSSGELHLVGAEIIRRKYPVVGVYQP